VPRVAVGVRVDGDADGRMGERPQAVASAPLSSPSSQWQATVRSGGTGDECHVRCAAGGVTIPDERFGMCYPL
jgi:hypothetical protein